MKLTMALTGIFRWIYLRIANRTFYGNRSPIVVKFTA